MMKRFFLILWMVFSLGFFGLHCGGTETGNPTVPSQNEDDIPEADPVPTDETGSSPEAVPTDIPFAEFLLDTLCKNLIECFQELVLDVCQEDMLSVTNIDQELGVEEGVYLNYEAIIEAEKSGQIVLETSAADECLSSIEALSCDEPSVRAAYDPNDPNNFDFVAEMIPESCQQVFVSE